jgi:hypothetical protein
MKKIETGEWYQDRNMFIEIVRILNDDWCEIHCMMLRDGIMHDDTKFLHEWTKKQYTPGGQWPVQGVYLVPDGPPQEILDALEWPSDGRGYRSLPVKRNW